MKTKHKHKHEDLIWTTKNGEKFLLSQLTDRHLLNIHRMLRQNIENTRSYLDVLGTCWAPRGEMAQEAFNQEFDSQIALDTYSRLWLVPMEKEVKWRGLTELPLK